MHFRLLGLYLLLLSGLTFAAPGRSPAVEDFVGIEVEQVEAAPHGSESLYNLEQDLSKIESARKGKPVDVAAPTLVGEAGPRSITTIIGMIFILGLPLISWMLVMNHLRKKASAESASNIEVLEKYRQERELAKKDSKGKDFKKAS